MAATSRTMTCGIIIGVNGGSNGLDDLLLNIPRMPAPAFKGEPGNVQTVLWLHAPQNPFIGYSLTTPPPLMGGPLERLL